MTNLTTLSIDTSPTETPSMKAVSNNIESIYPLAPMQEGLLFHTLMNPQQGMYLLQYRHVMEMEALDTTAFQKAWNAVVDRHELLRTAFVWKQQRRPLQVVYKQVDLPVELLDWRTMDEETQKRELERMLAEERRQELAFNKAPIMRVRLIRLGEQRYQFVRSYHHILMDAWCFSLIMMDFLAFYRAFAKGESLELEKPRPYRDFIRWLRQQPADAHKGFWTERLAGFDTPTSLGIRQPNQFPDADPVVDVVSHLDKAETKKLQALAAHHKVTLNTLLQGAWSLLLSRYSGEQDVLFGVTVAGRPTHMAGMESIVGLFINTLPLRWRVNPTDSLGDWLRSLQRENLALREHETSSLADIQQWSDVEGQDLFQSLFVFENAPMDAGLSQENLEFIVQDATNRTHTNYPITVVIIPGESLHLQLTYQGHDFSHAAVRTMLTHFQTLLQSMAELDEALDKGQGVNTTLDRLSMLHPSESLQQKQWAQGPELALDENYLERFYTQVAAAPNKVVVNDGTNALTYKALDQRSSRLAHRLVQQGVTVDSIVALLDERSSDFLVMILAVLKSGAAYLPLDPSHPPLRLAQVLKQSQTRRVLVGEGFESLARDALEVLSDDVLSKGVLSKDALSKNRSLDIHDDCIPELEVVSSADAFFVNDIDVVEDRPPAVDVSGQNLGYVIFTSGSTGTPKGAMVTRDGMLNNMLGKFAPLQLSHQDVIAQTASQCFDISVWQFLIAPILGARVEILPDAISQDPAKLVEAVERREITVLEPVPALIQGMLAYRTSFTRLRWVLPTGEALPPVLAQQWSERYSTIPLMNAYGPAECSDDVAFYPILERLGDDVRHVPIGSATANNRLYLLSPELEPMPIGAIGEIYVAGTGVGRGYLNEPERTAGVFLPNPFSDSSINKGERLYRTGDLARYLPDGHLQYVGRVDYQVKVRGYRIELGEIESRLVQHTEIDEVVLLAVSDPQRGKVLVAYIAGERLSVETQGGLSSDNWGPLREFVAQGLPDYMVPNTFVAMPKLPRNNNGKVDRKQLPDVDFSQQQEANYIAPSTPIEHTLSEIWQALLGLERVGVQDNFFELGGHSLLATQMAGQLTRELQRDVPLRAIFECPTIALLSTWLADHEPQNTLPPIKPAEQIQVQANGDKRAPLSWSQQRMWFLQQLEPHSAAYNLPAAIRIRATGKEKGLDLEIAERALNMVVAKHDILRTHFVIEQGAPVQVVSPHCDLSIRTTRLTSVEQNASLEHEASPEQALSNALKADAMQPFALDSGPLLRVHLFECEGRDHEQVLTFNCHHIIADAWSLRLFVDEFCTAYERLCAAESVEPTDQVSESRLQYSDFAIWQQALMEEGHLDDQLAYWLGVLQPQGDDTQSHAELPVLELSSDYPRPEKPSGAGQRYVTSMSEVLAKKLVAFDRVAGRSHFASTMAAFQLLLGFYSDQQDILIGVPVANRHHADTQNLMGCFINTLVHRADLTPEQTVTDLINAVAKQATQAQANQDLPFDYLIDQLGVDRQMSYNPLFQSMFNYLSGKALDQMTLTGLTVEAIDNRPDTALCDFKLDVQADDGRFNLSFEYSAELFAADTVMRMAQDYEHLLNWMLDHPQAKLSDITLWQEKSTVERVPEARQVLSLFADRVAEQPSALAVQTNGVDVDLSANICLTYAQLNAQSDRLAGLLRHAGLKRGDRVALCIERTYSMPVCMLAVLKCGSAYVPIEPSWPDERKGYVLSHASPTVCLLHSHHQSEIEALQPDLVCVAVDLCSLEHSDVDVASDRQAYDQADNDQTDNEGLDGVHPDSLAYILYTSGSTGRPKGVEITHHNVAHLCRDLSARIPLTHKDQVLSLTTYCFDISVVELLYPLTQGASILVASSEQAKDPRRLDQLLDHPDNVKSVSLMQATPATWTMLLARSQRSLDGVTAIAGGEALSAELGRQILARGATLMNGYGPTEVTVYSTFHPVTERDCQPSQSANVAHSSAALPIGKAVMGLRAHVLDRAMRPVPQGVTGELYLSGDGVGLGYHRAPELTANAFITHKHLSLLDGQQVYERLYKTGDLVRRRTDGTLDYVGRNDFQVKLRGFRIELGEIEALLPQLEGVDNAAVLLQGQGDQARLVAYWSGELRDIERLRRHLASSLPEYMVPTFWQWVERFPQNANGKVDRKALQNMPLTELVSGLDSDKRTAPQSLWEKRIAAIWREVLPIEESVSIAREDNFFALGGHSLLAARIVATLAEEFEVDLPLRSVFEAPTVMALAGEVELHVQPPLVIPVQSAAEADNRLAPMHATQKRLWFLEKFSGASRAYQLTLSLRVNGQLDVQALRQALYALTLRQQSLRTVFVEQDGELLQRVLPDADITLERVPLMQHELDADLLAECHDASLIKTLRGLADQPFVPEQSAPWRVDLLSAKSATSVDLDLSELDRQQVEAQHLDAKQLNNQQILQLSMHHLIADGWSLRIFFDELQALYRTALSSDRSKLTASDFIASDLPYQFTDYARWWQSDDTRQTLEQQLSYWKTKLAGEPPLLDLPTELPRPKQLSNRGQRYRFQLPESVVAQLKNVSAERQMTAFVPLLSAWQLLLSRYSGQHDIHVGVPVANRHLAHSGKIIGYFASTQVIKAPLGLQACVADNWMLLQQTLTEAQQHQDLPFEQLVESLELPRDNGRAPLFQTLFNLIQLDANTQFGGLSIERINLDEGTTLSEIGMQIEQAEQAWFCVLEYSSELFVEDTVARYARHYVSLLKDMLQMPEKRLCQLDMLDATDYALDAAFNATEAELKAEYDLIHRFEQQVLQTPDAEAIRYLDQSLSYFSLNEEVNRLAHYLRQKGMTAEHKVAILLDRGPRMMIAHLAVLKAGAAYIPLDPAQPADRLNYICQHAQPQLLITESHVSERVTGLFECLLLDVLPSVICEQAKSSEQAELSEEAGLSLFNRIDNPQPIIHFAQLAYLIYTSGSTGKPKGVAVNRGNLANFLYAMDHKIAIDSTDRWLSVTTTSFDMSVLEIYLPLLHGATLILADKQQSLDAGELFELLRQSTVFQATPASWQMLLTRQASDWPSLKGVIGGEAVPTHVAKHLVENGVQLLNAYGPTETTVWSTAHILDESEVTLEGVAAIGSPILNNRCYLLDEQWQPVPLGATGELYIAGEGVTRGYQDAPDLTASAFIPDPFRQDGSRLYKTGDLARRRSDGVLEYIGRSDFQIKIRGFRIELGEIETALRRQEGIVEVVVVADDKQRLVAFVQVDASRDHASLNANLRRCLENELPAYMVPYQCVILDTFVLNSNGKIDRKRLAAHASEIGLNSNPSQDSGRAPSGDIEVRLAEIWEALLGMSPSAEQSFFALGGHSLLAMQMISKVEAEFGLRLALQSLFEQPTIEALARQIAESTDDQQDDELDFMDQLLSEFED
ncbi:non-ribosomal peptide synthetase [Marinomonas mediterranea]|jgi:amino acid adenylation domain|uniref:Amino acid adenylation domain protein n=1 Tax=Marinomonas mediterranea (strain ATCC 700492 / JCM 21426 / NBRC 103028 / MMB-1) TaxID=717774 RepID=F2K4D2_MARM1|nr:non-ribosomal peptide synthetase [Marinomonas mediterranea]ADZ90231.1 amino acid adenylation domain protein [Marinomonas mediterranea MMB-1]WCN16426.1 non-ribosomal peptide synthetase [Marinomonas mediterranea MMB-1]